eukprot:4572226-Lingulodinium_polyedra.AAC.1
MAFPVGVHPGQTNLPRHDVQEGLAVLLWIITSSVSNACMPSPNTLDCFICLRRTPSQDGFGDIALHVVHDVA